MGLYLSPVFFSALKEVQIVLPLKTVFKLNLREADVTFLVGNTPFLLHMGPYSVYVMVPLVVFGIWISNLGTCSNKGFSCDRHH